MTFSLDTNVLIDLLNRRHLGLRIRYDSEFVGGAQMVIPALAAHEVIYGALISSDPERHVTAAQDLLRRHEVVDWSAADALAAARLRLDLRRRGETIGSVDTFIAGQALNRGWTLVTANTREFSRVEGLQVEDWTKG